MFTMIMGILELSMFFASGNILEGASQEAGRRIRTGQVQAANDPEQAFKDFLCANVSTILRCIADDTFGSAENMEPQFDEDGNLVPGSFDVGNSSDVILIRAHYKWEFVTPFIAAMLTGSPTDNTVSHLTTVVLKTEPYCTSIIQTNC